MSKNFVVLFGGCWAYLYRHAPPSRAQTAEECTHLSLSLFSSHTQALLSFPLSHTHVLALTRTQCCQEPLDHSHLQKEVPAEARESQSETKGRRTADGEERIRSGSRKERHSALWRAQSEEEEEGGVERKKKRRGNRKRDHFQLQRSVSQHGQCTIPRHVKPYLYAYLYNRFSSLLLHGVPSNQLAVLLLHSVEAGMKGRGGVCWTAAWL